MVNEILSYIQFQLGTLDWSLSWINVFEIVVIVAIIIFQTYILIKQLKKINGFKDLFNPKFVILPNPVNSIPNLSLRDNEFNDITPDHPLEKSVDSINTYMLKNSTKTILQLLVSNEYNDIIKETGIQ
jgi:hypothetical protein